MIREAIQHVCDGKNLEPVLVEQVAGEVMDGEATPTQISALLIGLRMKRETPDEIFSFMKTIRNRALRIHAERDGMIDLCGTGGDGKSTFNVSTIAAFVACGAGVPVAKHGNRAISGTCGSADLVQALGAALFQQPPRTAESIEGIGLGFLFAPLFHPALKNLQPVRREIGVRTMLNLMGPFLNPAGVRRQLIGFFSEEALELGVEIAKRLDGDRYLLVHSHDGLDEISIAAPTRAFLVEGDREQEMELTPESLGIRRRQADLRARSPEDNLKILFSVLDGQPSPFLDMVLANSGAAIFVSGRARDCREGVAMARESIESGAARDKLDEFIAFNREVSV